LPCRASGQRGTTKQDLRGEIYFLFELSPTTNFYPSWHVCRNSLLPFCRYGDKAAKWQLVDENLTLIDLMKKQDYVVPGVPLLFIVAKGTEYRERFLSQINK
jgi:hypothetical protein